MPSFQTIQQESDNRNLVRKIQRAIGFIAPLTVELPESITGEDSLPIDLKAAGFLPIGLVTPDGWSFGREVEAEDISALGYSSPVRSDTTTVARSVTVTPLESGKKHLLELKYGTDLSSVTQGANGEVVVDEPDLPIDAEYRLLVIGSDGPASENWIMGKGFGRVKLTGTGGETWGQEGAVSEEFTFNIFTDDEIGVPVRHYFGGTGAKAHKDVLGFTQAGA